VSEKPHRVQLSRKKGWRMPPNTVSVARPGPFGNPWTINECAANFDLSQACARERVVEWFRDWITRNSDDEALEVLGMYGMGAEHDRIHAHLTDLRGKNLACWCPLDQPCHADVLLELANK
jgi:hypothetical protein